MAVGKQNSVQCAPVKGVRLAAVAAGIRYAERLDLVLIELAEGSQVAGVFTQNAFCAAPVQVAKQHLQQSAPRYLLINTGNANAGTGTPGLEAARNSCAALAQLTGVDPAQVLPFSTGVIGERLPTDRLVAGLPAALDALDAGNWELAARGIMTTDTRPKCSSGTVEIGGQTVTLSGIAKGAGMIKPNMATMLAYVFTDAGISHVNLQSLLTAAVDKSFNRITVDGDTSTNDCCILVATGESAVQVDTEADLRAFSEVLQSLCQDLATQLIRDAEGATKFITIDIRGGATQQECLQVGYAIAESPLVKTAFFASDPNWGRILAAIGRAGLDNLDIAGVSIRLGETMLVEDGGLADGYTEADGQAEMARDEITISVDLNRGAFQEVLWTSDLSNDYVRINAEYRT